MDDEDLYSSFGSTKDLAPVEANPTPIATPMPEYTEEDLSRLIDYIHKATTLFALNKQDWSADTDEVIRRWLMSTDELLLTIFYDGDILSACLDFPLSPVFDITYFMREPGEIFEVETIPDRIMFGNIHEDIEGTLLTILDKVFSPIFFTSTNLSDNVKGQFCGAINNFLAYLTGLHYKMSGITVLYIPTEGLRLGVREAATDRDLVKRLEVIAVNWIASIRACLGDREQLVPFEQMCPPDHYDFYTYRCKFCIYFFLVGIFLPCFCCCETRSNV